MYLSALYKKNNRYKFRSGIPIIFGFMRDWLSTCVYFRINVSEILLCALSAEYTSDRFPII